MGSLKMIDCDDLTKIAALAALRDMLSVAEF
jgi:hypothetical protein